MVFKFCSKEKYCLDKINNMNQGKFKHFKYLFAMNRKLSFVLLALILLMNHPSTTKRSLKYLDLV